MQVLGSCEAAKSEKINFIPNNTVKYMTFCLGQLQFIHSLMFLNSSLDKLAENLSSVNLQVTVTHSDATMVGLLP